MSHICQLAQLVQGLPMLVVGEFVAVSPGEFGTALAWIGVKPPPQLGRRRHRLHPVVDPCLLFADSARPEPIHEYTTPIDVLRPVIDALHLERTFPLERPVRHNK